MEKAYRNISYLFVALLLISFVGFFQTYLVNFPTFTGAVTAHHIHGFLLMVRLWNMKDSSRRDRQCKRVDSAPELLIGALNVHFVATR